MQTIQTYWQRRGCRLRLAALCLQCAVAALHPSAGTAQTPLTLDSCRAMAVRNNKQLQVSRLKQDVALNLQRSARTKYLPHVSAIGTYQHTSEAISLLSNEQKGSLASLGTTTVGTMQALAGSSLETQMGNIGNMLAGAGVPAQQVQQMAADFQQYMGQTMTNTAGVMNALGQKIADAFNTDTRNVWAGSVMATQPLFMGGSIVALNKLADINGQMARNDAEARLQQVVYDTDRAYWQVVSLHHKKQLAESYLQLVTKLDDDVQKMIAEGVATRSDGLSVSVKVNEAEMALQKVGDGLALSRMLLCEIIGLPLAEPVVLADEKAPQAPGTAQAAATTATPPPAPNGVEEALANRPELRILGNIVDMGRQGTKMLKAGNLPQVALTGGYAVSNPNVLNGFQKKFGGFWNVGLLLRIPLWNWGDVAYKVRASKGATAIASLELQEARDMVELQVNQADFKVEEAGKRLTLAQKSIERAEENLHTASVGFREGVITPTVVMEAQTAWLQAQSQVIDAQIEMKLAQVDYQKALGTLTP